MKNKLNKIISSLLILAFLISMMTVFAFASEDSATTDTEISLLLNRSFDEGWNFDNGLSDASKGNNFRIDFEEDSEYNYNYFFRIETNDSQNAFAEFNFGVDAARGGATVLEMDIKLDDYASIGNILQAKTDVKEKVYSLLDIRNNALYAFSSTLITSLDNTWFHIAMIFDWDNDGACTIEYTDKSTGEKISKSLSYGAVSGDQGFKYFRFGVPGIEGAPAGVTLGDRIGMSYCLDNIQVYNSTEAKVASYISPKEYGSKVNLAQEKPVDIQTGSGNKSDAQLLAEALCMKVGVNYALIRDEKQPIFTDSETSEIYGAPVFKDDQVMIPLQLLLDYIDFPYYLHPDNASFDITTGTSVTYITVGRDNAKVDTTRVDLTVAPSYVANGDSKPYLAIALADVETLFPGWLVSFDDMGLIVIYEDTTPDNKDDNTEIVDRKTNLGMMLDLMKKFIFETVDMAKPEDTYIATGKQVYEDAKANTNNFDHPYIYVDQSTFDKIKTTYDEGIDERLSEQVTSLVNSANAEMNKYANMNGNNFVSLAFDPVNPYKDGLNPDPSNPSDTTIADTTDGYDPDGGRLNIIGTYTAFLPKIAFAYQVTGAKKYVDFAYYWMAELVQWEHWGPGHFLNAAEATASFAVAYDWLYDAFKQYGYDTDLLAKGIFELGVHDGYVSSTGKMCEHPRNLGDGSIYNTAKSNWNAVCTAGMVIGSLAILDYVDEEGRATYLSETTYLMGNNMISLATYGLDEYAPDGSYIESASYWAYGTNFFFRLVMALDSATGKDYGFMDTWGIDKTCYYACQIVSSDGKMWNYHDGGGDGVTTGSLGTVDSSSFAFVGKYLNDPALIALRQEHLERKYASVSLYDVLFYPFDDDENADVDVDLPLDYYMQGIEGFVSRDSWDKGAMYTGLMGGANNCNHGQIDSGNFIYHNKGIVWFMDLGSEDYNTYGYFGSQRHKYYRANSEGQNVILTSSDQKNIMYGQHSGGAGVITNTFTNEHGSYAWLDNSSAYLDTVYFARRGILVTNDRQTVVIQDQISVVKVQTYHWVAHTAAEIDISEDGKTAYLTQKDADGKEYTLRASLVSERRDLVFEERSVTEDFLLDATASPDYSSTYGGVAEYSREGIKRLVVTCDQTSIFDIAVVIELVDGIDSEMPVGYDWADMYTWEPSAPKDPGDVQEIREIAIRSDISNGNQMATTIFKRNDAFTSANMDRLYKELATVAYAFKTFNPYDDPTLVDSYLTHEEHVEKYEEYTAFMTKVFENTKRLGETLVGFNFNISDDAGVAE